MFPHRTASATKHRPRTGPKYRSGKRPLLPFRTLLLAALLLSGIRCALAQPRIGIAYCDLDHLYDTIPALFYDDSDYTPGGRLAWDTERYRRKIARTAAVIDSMHKAVSEMGVQETFHGYGPDYGYDFLVNAIREHDYASRGVQVDFDEVFISDGAKCDVVGTKIMLDFNKGDIKRASDHIPVLVDVKFQC